MEYQSLLLHIVGRSKLRDVSILYTKQLRDMMEIRKSIVVNSTPVRVAEEYSEVKEIHVLDIPKPYKKRNIGLEESKYEWLLYLDDDCIVDKEILNIFYKIVLMYIYFGLSFCKVSDCEICELKSL